MHIIYFCANCGSVTKVKEVGDFCNHSSEHLCLVGFLAELCGWSRFQDSFQASQWTLSKLQYLTKINTVFSTALSSL